MLNEQPHEARSSIEIAHFALTFVGLVITAAGIVTVTPASSVGIWPFAKSGALSQVTPPAGVSAGTRFVPLIVIQVFSAIFGPPYAVVTEVMTGLPAAAAVMVPVPLIMPLLAPKEGKLSVNVPVAPFQAPTPPVTTPVTVCGMGLFEIAMNTLKLSAPGRKLKVAVPLKRLDGSYGVESDKSRDDNITFPNGFTVPLPVASKMIWKVTLPKYVQLREKDVVFWETVIVPEPVSVPPSATSGKQMPPLLPQPGVSIVTEKVPDPVPPA